jgi:hypothetical protein
MIIWQLEGDNASSKSLAFENLSLSLQSDGWRTPSKSKNKYLAFHLNDLLLIYHA